MRPDITTAVALPQPSRSTPPLDLLLLELALLADSAGSGLLLLELPLLADSVAGGLLLHGSSSAGVALTAHAGGGRSRLRARPSAQRAGRGARGAV